MTVRTQNEVFMPQAKLSAFDTGSQNVLGIRQINGEQTLTALFNFSEHERAVVLEEIVPYTDLMTGEKRDNKVIYLKPYAFLWAMADETAE